MAARYPHSWAIGAGALVLVIVGLIFARTRDNRGEEDAKKKTTAGTKSPPSNGIGRSPEKAPPTPKEIMEMWRTAVMRRDRTEIERTHVKILAEWNVYREDVLLLAEKDPNGRIRSMNIGLLIAKKEKSLLAFYARRLEEDDNIYVRWNCCRALGLFGGTKYKELLERVSEKDIDYVAKKARWALSKLK